LESLQLALLFSVLSSGLLMESERCGADDAGVFAQRRETYFDGFGLDGPDVFIEETPDTLQQDFAGGDHSACKDNALRLGGVQHVDAGNRQRLCGSVGDLFGQLVAGG
jgi:hypothetical protein